VSSFLEAIKRGGDAVDRFRELGNGQVAYKVLFGTPPEAKRRALEERV
jgi:hypothetical protein